MDLQDGQHPTWQPAGDATAARKGTAPGQAAAREIPNRVAMQGKKTAIRAKKGREKVRAAKKPSRKTVTASHCGLCWPKQ
jgi:hypothetical protein